MLPLSFQPLFKDIAAAPISIAAYINALCAYPLQGIHNRVGETTLKLIQSGRLQTRKLVGDLRMRNILAHSRYTHPNTVSAAFGPFNLSGWVIRTDAWRQLRPSQEEVNFFRKRLVGTIELVRREARLALLKILRANPPKSYGMMRIS